MAFAYKGKNINILNAYRRNARKPFSSNMAFWITTILLSLTAILLAAYSYIGYKIISVNNEAVFLKEYTENAVNLALYENALESTQKAASLKAQREKLLECKKELDSIPLLSKKDLERFLECRGAYINISNIVYISSNSTLAFDADTSSFMNIRWYIRRLEQTGIFSSIEYYGYQKDGDQSYGFSVTCRLKAVAE